MATYTASSLLHVSVCEKLLKTRSAEPCVSCHRLRFELAFLPRQGLSFHLGAVLISLGFITYVEHGESRPNVLPSTLEAFHLEKVLSVAVAANCSRYGTVALLTAVPVI